MFACDVFDGDDDDDDDDNDDDEDVVIVVIVVVIVVKRAFTITMLFIHCLEYVYLVVQ